MIALAGTPVLRTDRLNLRAPEGGDWPAFRAFQTSDRARFVRQDGDVRTAWRAFGHIIGHWAMRGFGPFVFHRHDDPTPLGTAVPWHPQGWPEREVGWTVWHPQAEGTGLAAEAARAALDHVFRDLGWQTAVSYIDPGNARSIALAERLGARRDPEAAGPHPGDLVYRHPRPA